MLTSRTGKNPAGPPRRPALYTLTAAALAVPALSGAALAGTALLAPAAAAQSGPAPSCSAGTCTVSFTTPGTGQAFTVPAGVSSLSVTLYGGTGGTNYGKNVAGGDGAEVTATLAVTPDAALGVDVGGAGQGGTAQAAGGVNGGGTGHYSGGGGGATDITSSGTRLLVAGGGGGAGADVPELADCGPGSSSLGGAGGDADTAGGTGQGTSSDGLTLNGGGGGAPGTVTAAGSGAAGAGGSGGTVTGTDPCPGGSAGAGDAGAGGSGGTGGSAGDLLGGAGGGGYFGGGAGGTGATESAAGAGAGGGGGGASYTDGTGVSAANVDDTGNTGSVNSGNGEAILSYTNPVATGSPSYTTTAGQTLTVPASAGLLSAAAGTSPASGLTASVTSATTTAGGTITLDTSGDGGFTYTPPAGYTGTDSFSYTVTDATGDYATGTATITVAAAAQVITFTTSPPSPAVVGGTYTPAATGGGSGNPVTFSIDSASTTGACTLTSGVVSFTGPGTCTIDANQAAGNGYTAAQEAQQVITVDQKPAFTIDSPPTSATAGQVYSYSFVASGTPAPAYSLSGAPSWLSVDSSTGEVSGTVPSGTKSFSYSVTATNAAGTATAGPFTVTVTAASVKADLAASLSCPAGLTRGKTGTCTLTVTNHGPATANKVAAAIALPASLGATACSAGCARLGNVITWTTASLADGASVSYTVTVKAAAAGKALVLAAAASASPDPDPLNNIALATITISR